MSDQLHEAVEKKIAEFRERAAMLSSPKITPLENLGQRAFNSCADELAALLAAHPREGKEQEVSVSPAHQTLLVHYNNSPAPDKNVELAQERVREATIDLVQIMEAEMDCAMSIGGISKVKAVMDALFTSTAAHSAKSSEAFKPGEIDEQTWACGHGKWAAKGDCITC